MEYKELMDKGYDVALHRPAACDACLAEVRIQEGHWLCDISQIDVEHLVAWKRGEIDNEFIGGRWVWIWA